MRDARVGYRGISLIRKSKTWNVEQVVDPDGGMLAGDWEGPATALANAQDVGGVQDVLASLFPAGASIYIRGNNSCVHLCPWY